MPSELSYFGDHLLVGLAGTGILPAERRYLKELRPLGIILFAKNFERSNWQSTHTDLFKRALDLTKREDLLLTIDHEGGRVHRFPAPVTRFPAARTWSESARAVGEAMGAELAALGYHLSFAPVLDVHSEPTNPVIGERALAVTPGDVARYGTEFWQGLESRGLIGCGKHFPGHGATTQDSHFVLPRMEAPVSLLREREVAPFKALIDAGIPLLMTAHVIYPALDEENPATLSRKIATDLLRGELGFRGALITDDLEMKALASLSPERKAIAALSAGIDILCEANPESGTALYVGEKMLREIAKQADKGTLDLSVSRERIAKLIEEKRRLDPVRLQYAAREELVGAAEHAALAERLQSVTV